MLDASDVTVTVLGVEGREKLLERALASVAAQVGCDVPELIVDVAAPTWDRKEVARRRNALLSRVETPWCATLDDDDEWLPWHLQMVMRRAGAIDFLGAVQPRGTCVGRREGDAFYSLGCSLIHVERLAEIGGWIWAPGCHVDYATAYVLSERWPIHNLTDRATWIHHIGPHRQMVGAVRGQELRL